MKKQLLSDVRKLVPVLVAITLVFTMSACKNRNKDKDNGSKNTETTSTENTVKEEEDPNVQRFKDAAMRLNETEKDFGEGRDSELLGTGLRLASLISLNELQKMLPCPLFVSGPHNNGEWDFENDYDFGHYNPEAIEYLSKLANKVVSDKAFVEMSKPYIDRYLFIHMHIMMVLHDALYCEQLYTEDKRELMFRNSLKLNGHHVTAAYHLKSSLNLEDGSYTYFNWGNNYLYFWARRWSDGTIGQFYDVLRTVFMAYYPDYEFDLSNYLIEEEWNDPSWEDEEEEVLDPMSWSFWGLLGDDDPEEEE